MPMCECASLSSLLNMQHGPSAVIVNRRLWVLQVGWKGCILQRRLCQGRDGVQTCCGAQASGAACPGRPRKCADGSEQRPRGCCHICTSGGLLLHSPIPHTRDPLQHGISRIDKRNWWQVKLARTKSDLAKQREFLWRSAEALDRIGDLEAAETQLKGLLKMPLDSEEQRIEALCFLADLQVLTFACARTQLGIILYACFCPP